MVDNEGSAVGLATKSSSAAMRQWLPLTIGKLRSHRSAAPLLHMTNTRATRVIDCDFVKTSANAPLLCRYEDSEVEGEEDEEDEEEEEEEEEEEKEEKEEGTFSHFLKTPLPSHSSTYNN